MEKVVGSMVDGKENVGRFARRLGGGMFPGEIPVGIVNWTVKEGGCVSYPQGCHLHRNCAWSESATVLP